MPKFFIDLNLDQVIYKVNSLRKNYEISALYYMMPDSEKSMELRRSVFCDVKKEKVFSFFSEISDDLRNIRKLISLAEDSEFAPQSNFYRLSACSLYVSTLEKIAAFDDSLLEAEVLNNIINTVKSETETAEFKTFAEETGKISAEADGLSYKLLLEKDHYYVKDTAAAKNKEKEDSPENAVKIMDVLKKAFPELKDTGFASPFSGRKGLSYIETDAYQALKKEHGKCFAACADAVSRYKDMISGAVFDLEYELQFYLSFVIFEKYMQDNGFSFTKPYPGEEIRAEGIYDTALALSLFGGGRPVIDNEVLLAKEEKFLVVTGPNQGGKTTFARAVGQLLYFYMMGLDVPAAKASLPYFAQILTHFSVEESTETGQGKLKEELSRLAPMLSGEKGNCFVILNELFTTAATLDAAQMGTKVMKAFADKGCKGIYVTHIKELTETEHSVSMVAVCDENDYHRRLYKIIRKPAEGLGYAGAIVEKYGLTYEGLQEKLKEKGLI